MFRGLFAHHLEVKIVLYNIWYHHTETSELSEITEIQFYKYKNKVVKFMCEFFGCDYCILFTIIINPIVVPCIFVESLLLSTNNYAYIAFT